jgi:hypothetical protein
LLREVLYLLREALYFLVKRFEVGGWDGQSRPIPLPPLGLLPAIAFFSRSCPLCPSIPPAPRPPRGESGFAPLAGIGLVVMSPASTYGLNLLGSPSPGEMTTGQVL